MMLPMILYVIPLYRFVFSMGLSDTIPGVALPFLISPLSVFIMMQFLEDLPIEFIESARIDGAGHFNIYFRIVLPLLRNGLITATVLLFLKVWGSFLWPSLVAADNIQPMSVTIANLLSPQFYVDPRVKIASMLLAMLPPMVIYIFFQRYVIRGISMSGVKG
jgi:multiple sugar transport system permease protein